MKKINYLAVLIIVFFAFFLISSYKIILEFPANFLIIKNPETVENSDACVVLSGEQGERINYASELYKKGICKFLIITGHTPGFTVYQMKELALKNGVKEKDIIVEPQAESTLENALFTKKILKEKKAQSAIIITSSYHSRRTRWVFKKVFDGDKIKIQVLYSPYSWFEAKDWYKKPGHREILKREYERLIWYFFNFYMIRKDFKRTL